ncbi:prolyl oligopeptidase family serine peptidase [Caulobacter segnis]|uniref:S9 family peptidase n=1 Tax=Caulobacter segnis TaxID=88688 RepID=UPI00240F6927|nr:prolyl oligopeptidase family serine peptidase [Caulobacter segnis]MDG2521225.1 prolyl oligopeptidase family serine peptidase [Caulobacter segnis]
MLIRLATSIIATWMMGAGVAAACDLKCVETRTAPFTADGLAEALADITPSRTKVLWLDAHRLAYVRPRLGDATLTLIDARRPHLRRTRTAASLAAQIGMTATPTQLKNLQLIAVEGGSLRLELAGQSLLFSPAENRARRATRDPSAAISPSGEWEVRTRDHDLYANGPKGPVRLSHDGELWRSFAGAMSETQPSDRPVVEGRADAAPPRVGWIGRGPKFYIQRQDLRATGALWMVNSLASPRPRLITQKYPLPGESPLPVSELWVFDAETGQGRQIDTGGWTHVGNLDPGAGGVWPSRDGRTLYFARMDRGYGRVQLCAADLETGAVRVLVDEHPAGGSSIRMADFAELKSGFVWKTEIDGFHHYARYDAQGRFKADLTPGEMSVRDIVRVDETHGELVYRSFDDARVRNPAQMRLRAASLSGGPSRALDLEDADHDVSLSPTGLYWTDTVSRADLAPTLILRTRTAKAVPLERSDLGKLEKTGWRAPERIRVLAADGATPLYGVLWKPIGLDAGKTAPIVADVYPGPSAEKVPVIFNPIDPNYSMAQLGLAVLSVGQRGGMSGRGKAYHSYARAFGSVRDYPVADNMAALRAVAQSHPQLDIDRVGIIGHSGGGFMAATALLLEPKFYKVAVASSGNHDNNLYEMGSGEFHFGAPKDGPAGGALGYAVNQTLASRLEGDLLLIHGDLDEDVPLGSTLRLMRALIDAGKSFDTLILPGDGHSFPAADARYVRLRSWRYLLQHLDASAEARVQ